MTDQQRWCLLQDDDGHWYLVPAERRREFYERLNDADWNWWDEAEGFDQYRLGGAPDITFTDPRMGY